MVFQAHCATKTNGGGEVMNRSMNAGGAIVLPGLFFVSGAASGEVSKIKMNRANKQYNGDIPFRKIVNIHWSSTPKLLLLVVIIMVGNVLMIALNQGLVTDEWCKEYRSTDCRRYWGARHIIFHSWFLIALLLCQAFLFFYSASRAYKRRSCKWYICYALQAVMFASVLGWVVATDFYGTYEVEYTGTKVGYLLVHFGILFMTMLPHGKRFAFPVYVTCLMCLFSYHPILKWGKTNSKVGSLLSIEVIPAYISGVLTREDAFLTGWLRKQMTAYLWLPIFSIYAVGMLVDDCIGNERDRMEKQTHMWVGQLYVTFVLYGCGLQEMCRHLHITRAQNLSSIAFYVFHPLLMEIMFQITPYTWKGDHYWWGLGAPYFFHSSTLLVMMLPCCKRKHNSRAQVQGQTAESAPTAEPDPSSMADVVPKTE